MQEPKTKGTVLQQGERRFPMGKFGGANRMAVPFPVSGVGNKPVTRRNRFYPGESMPAPRQCASTLEVCHVAYFGPVVCYTEFGDNKERVYHFGGNGGCPVGSILLFQSPFAVKQFH
jgi:hypothetical protein